MYNFLVGKAARKEGEVAFNIMASEAYSNMGEDDHKVLKENIPKETAKWVLRLWNAKELNYFIAGEFLIVLEQQVHVGNIRCACFYNVINNVPMPTVH